MGSHSQLDLSKKFKTANDRLRGISSSKDGWKPPLRKHFSPYGEVDFVTIQVRIFTGITEHNFHAKFLPGHHTAEKICSAIAEKEGLTPPEAQLFSLWVAGRDIEIQLKPKEDVFALMEDWNAWVSKYTHYPESIDPAHPINQHWFLYRREASLTTKAEVFVLRRDQGQARWNYLAGRYLCTTQEAVDLAAIQLQSSIGNYDQEKCPPGFLDKDRISVLIPEYHLDAFKAKEWESIIVDKFKQYSGYSAVVSRQQYSVLW
ncbi:hypothetical protein EDD86DRAFT_231575 [Gorgonomyces haynaldii]|nr:hypothetical protein EDD86DRAFT_231575 [Gorgonomyces haynaldii]